MIPISAPPLIPSDSTLDQNCVVEEEMALDRNNEEAESEIVVCPPMIPISVPPLIPSDSTLDQNCVVEEKITVDQDDEEAESEIVLWPPMIPISTPSLIPSGSTLDQNCVVEEKITVDQDDEEAESEIVLWPPMIPISTPSPIPSDSTIDQNCVVEEEMAVDENDEKAETEVVLWPPTKNNDETLPALSDDTLDGACDVGEEVSLDQNSEETEMDVVLRSPKKSICVPLHLPMDQTFVVEENVQLDQYSNDAQTKPMKPILDPLLVPLEDTSDQTCVDKEKISLYKNSEKAQNEVVLWPPIKQPICDPILKLLNDTLDLTCVPKRYIPLDQTSEEAKTEVLQRSLMKSICEYLNFPPNDTLKDAATEMLLWCPTEPICEPSLVPSDNTLGQTYGDEEEGSLDPNSEKGEMDAVFWPSVRPSFEHLWVPSDDTPGPTCTVKEEVSVGQNGEEDGTVVLQQTMKSICETLHLISDDTLDKTCVLEKMVSLDQNSEKAEGRGELARPMTPYSHSLPVFLYDTMNQPCADESTVECEALLDQNSEVAEEEVVLPSSMKHALILPLNATPIQISRVEEEVSRDQKSEEFDERKILLRPLTPIREFLLVPPNDTPSQDYSGKAEASRENDIEESEKEVALPAPKKHSSDLCLGVWDDEFKYTCAVDDEVSQYQDIEDAEEDVALLQSLNPILTPLSDVLDQTSAVVELVSQDQNSEDAKDKIAPMTLVKSINDLLLLVPPDNTPNAFVEKVSRDQNSERAEAEMVIPQSMAPVSDPHLVPSYDTLSAVEKDFSRLQTSEDTKENTMKSISVTLDNSLEQSEQQTENQSELCVSAGCAGDEDKALQNRMFAVREIVSTEQEYVQDLGLIVNGYIPLMRDPKSEIKIPKDLRDGKEKLIFCNIELIYKWHNNVFLKALKRCVEHPDELGPLFINCQHNLYLHALFCKNKFISEQLVSQYIDTYFAKLKKKMGHKLTLCDLMILPVQRVTRYPLLLEVLYKYTEQANLVDELEALKQAWQIMEGIAYAADGMMFISRLQGFNGMEAAHGQLLLHGPLVCCEKKSLGAKFKGKVYQVFLFVKVLIFSTVVCKKLLCTRYDYKNHIQVNKMGLEEVVEGRKEKDGGGVELFCVRNLIDLRKSYVCQAETAELRAKWIHGLRKVLRVQDDFLKALEMPINDLTRPRYRKKN